MNGSYIKIKNPVFRHVCEQIVRKECVPFLGSGISNDCKYTGSNNAFNNNGHEGHLVAGMKSKLQGNGKNLGEKCEQFLWESQSDLKESFKKLIEILQVSEFTNLSPTIGHFCIALLVREGLLSQIITTNYDCALERAFLQSFGKKCTVKSKSNRDESCGEYVSIVHDQKSCVHQRPGLRGSGECLHLYKINGCACALNRENEHTKILLTATQLQDWRDRRWAKDTFRVILRSNTVLFSGFGSGEPQVIHTVHQILDEYSSFMCSLSTSLTQDNLPPNIPVIHCFEIEPDFCQLQIANNFVQAYSGKFNQDFAKELILTRKSLDGNSSGKRFDANDFWLMIYQEVQNLQVINILSNASKGQLAVSAFSMSKFLFEEIKKNWDADKSILRNLFLNKTDIEYLPTNLAKLLSFLINGGNKYAPLQQYQNSICECLLIYWAFKPDYSQLTFYKDKQNTQWLKLINSNNNVLYVTGERPLRSEIQDIDKIDVVVPTTGFLLTTGYSLKSSSEKTLRFVYDVKGVKSYQKVTLFTFSELMVLAGRNIKSGGLKEYENFFSDLARYPRKWRSRIDTGRKEDRYSRRFKDEY